MPVTPAQPTPFHQRTQRRYFLLTALVLVVAATVRLWGLGEKSLWLDEIMTVQKASGSFSAMMDQIRQHDAHPPFFQVVEWLWLKTGRSDGWARIPSVLAGVIGVWLSMRVARRLLGRRAAYAAGVLMAISAFHIFYSQEARLQTLVTALFLGQVCVLLAILDRRGKAGWGMWLAYGLLGIVSLYTYALCILTLGALGVVYLWRSWRRRPRREWAVWAGVHLLIGLLFLPWVPVLRERSAILEASVRAHGDATGLPTFGQLSGGVVEWCVGIMPGGEALGYWPTGLGVALLLLAALPLLLRRSRRAAAVLGALFILPLAGYLLLPMPRVHLYEPKHLPFLQPILIIALAGMAGYVTGPRKSGRSTALAVLATAVLIFLAVGNISELHGYFSPAYEKENWRGLCADVKAQVEPADLILFNPDYVGFAFDYYAALPNDRIVASRLQPDVRLDPRYPRVWLVEGFSPVERPYPGVPGTLAALGWQQVNTGAYSGGVGNVRWILYARQSK